MTEKLTAREVLSAIFARHKGEEWVTFAEVADGTGMNASRRADAVCMNIWPSKGYAIHGFEIKVSRADFLHEMKDITKAEAVGQYCDFWWLVAAPGIASIEELPASWGLMECHRNGLKIKKQAPKRENPADISRRFMASLLRKSRDEDKSHIAAQVDMQLRAEREAMERRLASDRERQKSRAEEAAARNRNWIEDFERRLGVKFATYPTAERMVERMRVAESLDLGALSRIAAACDQVKALSESLRQPPGEDDLLV